MSQALTAVLMLLSLYDRAPTPAELSAAAPDDPAGVLLVVADDPDVPAWKRRRAIDALGAFPDERVRRRLVEMLAEDAEASEAPRRLHRVVYALARGWGAGAWRDLKTLSGHPDLRLQDTLDDAARRAARP